MERLFALFLNNLLPIFLMAGAGYALAHLVGLEAGTISRVVFYIFSPCLVFTLISKSQLSEVDFFKISGFAVAQMLLLGGIALVVGLLLRLDRRLLVAVTIAALFPNAGNYGMSVTQFAFGETALAFASLYFVTSSILLNSLGVFIASLGHYNIWQALAGLLKIPSLYSVILALLFQRMNWNLPFPLERSVSLLGQAAIPGMLILLGLQVQRAKWTGQWKGLFLAVVVRLGISIPLGLGLSQVFGLTGAAHQAGVLEGSMPSAVMSTILATEFDVEPAFTTQVVFFTTLLSPLTITPMMAYLGG